MVQTTFDLCYLKIVVILAKGFILMQHFRLIECNIGSILAQNVKDTRLKYGNKN